MRKEQLKIIERAKKRNFVPSQIAILSKEDLTIQELHIVMDYFVDGNNKVDDKEKLVEEVARCLEYLTPYKGTIKHSDYIVLLKCLLPSYRINDTLIGSSKKRRLLKMYQFLMRKVQKVENIPYLLHSYAYMLYNDIPTWHINMFLRKSKFDSSASTIFNSEAIRDDYVHNGTESLLGYMFEKEYDGYLWVDKKKLDALYDREAHRFSIPQDDFDKLFVKSKNMFDATQWITNEDYYAQWAKKKYTIVSFVSNICQQIGLLLDNKHEENSYQIFCLCDPSMDKKIKECRAILGQGFTTNTGALYFNVKISKNYFITVTLKKYKTIYVGANNENGWSVNSPESTVSFMISPDGWLYQKMQQVSKYFPLPMRDFVRLYKENNICGEFMHHLLNFYIEKNIFYKDVVNDFSTANGIMPLTFNEVFKYHNRAELLLNKYKLASELPIKWNKQNLALSYLIIKSYPLVKLEKSRQILLQQKDDCLLKDGDYRIKTTKKPNEFLARIMYKKISENELKSHAKERELLEEKYRKELETEMNTNVLSDEYEQWIKERLDNEFNLEGLIGTIRDYINMCRQTKSPIRLDIYSMKQMKKIHDRVATNPIDYRKNTGIVEVPKKSKFLPLREILPPEFEWIKTRKRLILETELQHHCVWSYASSITSDSCAIYSFTDTKAEHSVDSVAKRYTIEFRQGKDKRYYVEQVQGKYDKANASGMKQYIQSLLDQYQLNQYEREKDE